MGGAAPRRRLRPATRRLAGVARSSSWWGPPPGSVVCPTHSSAAADAPVQWRRRRNGFAAGARNATLGVRVLTLRARLAVTTRTIALPGWAGGVAGRSEPRVGDKGDEPLGGTAAGQPMDQHAGGK